MASRTSKALFAVSLAGCVTLTGCANPPSAAAKVNGTTISAAQVEEAVAGCGAVYAEKFNEPLDAAALRPQMASWLVYGEFARALEEASGLTVSSSDLERYLNRYTDLPVMHSDPRCAPVVEGLARYEVVGVQLVGGELWKDYFSDLDIDINPRYGAWNPNTSQVDFVPSGGLARVVGR